MTSTPIQKWTRLCQELEKTISVFERTGLRRRTAAYKKTKLSDISVWYEEVKKVNLEIDKLFITNSPDPCYTSKNEEIKVKYQAYVKELKEIPETVVSRNEETSRDLTDGQAFYRQQKTRLQSIQKSLEDVEDKLMAGEKLTPAYCKLKNKLISDSWNRALIKHEECEIEREDIPAEYEVLLQDVEMSIENVLLILHENMEEQKTEGLKLPRMTIPKFSGDYFKWISFRDLFVSLVKDNKTISDGQKMQLLKQNLTGDADDLVSDLTISDVNFEGAWKRLLDCYDNARVVVKKHLIKLMNQSNIKTESKSVKKLLDTTDQLLLALANLNRPVEHWDDWIVMVISQKLSEEVRKDWEKTIGSSTEIPTWIQMKTFLMEEFRILEGIESNNKRSGNSEGKSTEKPASTGIKNYHSAVENGENNCPACDESHQLFSCNKFKAMDLQSRWEVAKKKKLCFLCLKKHKDALKCDKKKPCKHCDKPHSTWLHDSKSEQPKAVVNAFGAIKSNKKQVLLATALISTIDQFGRRVTLRALIDSGSQGSMITDKAAASLNLNQILSKNYISGLGGNNTNKVKYIHLTIKPRFMSNVQMSIQCYILKMLTTTLPDSNLCIENWHHLKGLQLADPTFHQMGPIDLLLGMDVVSEILRGGFKKGPRGSPMAQETSLGWIVSGNINPTYPSKVIKCLVATTPDDDLSKFWELEELNPKRKLTPKERECEEHYQQTHCRDEQGLFTVKIPFKTDPTVLGYSKAQCVARFRQLEKRFERDAKLKTDYIASITEYIEAGHLIPVDHLKQSDKLYYIPHHAVVKPEKLTTKTRVVFDASAKTSSGVSLNDCMHTGAKQQRDLLEILINWRKYKIVFKADIEKMYRMIKLDKEDQRYHTIVWRKDSTEPIQEYQLTTVTFGTAAAPFMATRCINQIAKEVENQQPETSKILMNDFYVDDLISGCDDVDNAIQIKDELLTTLASGGMKLRKWTSNSEKLLQHIEPEMTERSLQTFDVDEGTKALGLQWNPKTDRFTFRIKPMVGTSLTKRELLSHACRIFDPLGWLAPIVVKPKLLMQGVWDYKIKWDDQVAPEIRDEWNQFSTEMPSLADIQIPRWIGCVLGDEIQLHGFCDASERAYAAVVYTRVKKGSSVEIQLVAAKTRVAPLATKITLPKLELNGAVLLANLLDTTKESLQLPEARMFSWCDSMVTLGWIQGEPLRWKTFVANRVSDIQSTESKIWKYVPTDDNPADCASRGLMPSELKNHPLWWTGPKWLKEGIEAWPRIEIEDTEAEQRRIVVNAATLEPANSWIDASSWTKMVRIMAYVRRFGNLGSKGKFFTVAELESARKALYKQCQRETFAKEIDDLLKKRPVDKNSKLISLNPFVDADGILRVGGRLQNSIISYDNKHPIILPHGHRMSKLIVRQMHLDTLHGGPQLMINLLRKKYWMVQGKRMANEMYKSCVNCRRFCAKNEQPIMGNLPKDRVTLERAFLVTGVDYAGPVEIKTSRIRNAKITKGYIAIFVCFATKATHLELVSDMTTEAFLAALHRFIARRGLCARIYSDNGSNFLGSANKLADNERKWFHSMNQELAANISSKGIDWHFIPPGAPNFGGLWERGVRSMKDHLKRTLKNTRLTFEEYGTVLCQVEACLNSRPICALSSDLENLNALTPGHFLIGDALLAPPQLKLADTTANKVNRWNHLQLLQQHFWNRWHKEYLNTLQQRNKWQTGEANVSIGDIVLVKDERLTPRNWLMGKITELHAGEDSKIRVVTLQTKGGELKRPINKICPLLSNDEDTESEDNQPANQDQHEIEDHDLGPDDRKMDLAKAVTPVRYETTPRKKVSFQLPDNQEARHTARKLRPRVTAKAAMIATIIGLCLILGGGASQSTHAIISPFTRNAGIYFEDVGRAETIKTEWHIWIRLQTTPYFEEIKRVQNMTKQLASECKKFELSTSMAYCNELAGLIQNNIDTLISTNELMEYHTDFDPSRTKRAAPLNVVGWIGHEVCGIMAADQAEGIESHFKSVEEQSSHQLQLIKNQTSIVEGTVKLMRATQNELNQNYARIDTAMNEIIIESNNTEKKLKVGAISVLMLGIVNRLEKIQSQMVDMVTDLHEGRISSQVFTTHQFKQQLQLINENLPVGNKLPEIAKHDIKSLYKIIKGSARVSASGIILEIVFPLVAGAEYQVMKLIPIPMKYNGRQIKIKTESKYLMINLKRDGFYQVSEEQYRTCLKPKHRMFICHLSPLYTIPSTRSICERDLLNDVAELNQGCNFDMSDEKEFWIQLEQRNRWIFGITNKRTVNIVCGQDIHPMQMSGMGTLDMAPGCELNQPGMTITSEAHKQSNGNINYYPLVNLSEAVVTSGWRNHIKKLDLTLDHTEHLENLLQSIEILKQQSNTTRKHHLYNYGAKGLYGFVIIVLIFVIWWKRIAIVDRMMSWHRTARSNNGGSSDIETGQDGGTISDDNIETSSSDASGEPKNSTVARHEAGECPFRT